MIKLKLTSHDRVDKELFKSSHASRISLGEEMRQKSYSSVKLPMKN